jgi:1-deoxy-D-xylulose-5-phosphate synthase
MSTLRMHGGVSGFPKRCESPYDTFGVGHSSTSISAALGMALAAKHKGEDRKAIAVIGDGAMSAGMAFEALNNAGVADADMLVILNDNEMSISPPVGALNNILTRLTSSKTYNVAREAGRHMLGFAPPLLELARRAEEHAVRGIRFPLLRPDRWPRPRRPDPDAGKPEEAQGPEVPPRHHQEGPGLQAGRGRPHPLPRRRQVRRL